MSIDAVHMTYAYSTIMLARRTGMGTVRRLTTMLKWLAVLFISCSGVVTGQSFNVINFAGNGLSGVLVYDPLDGTAYTALSNGDGTFRYVYNLFTQGFDTLVTGDFKGDGKADVILYNSKTALAYIGFGNGNGTFTFQSLFWSPGYDCVETFDGN